MPGHLLFWVAAALLGLCVGSLLNGIVATAGQPMPRFRTPSRCVCPACRAPKRVRDGLPLLGYMLLRGRCRGCRAAIPALRPMVELLGCGVALLALWRHGPSPAALAACGFGWVCVVIAALDWQDQQIPWRFPLVGTTALLAWGAAGPGLPAAGAALLDGLLTAGLLAGVAALVGWAAGKPFGSEHSVMGEADVVVALFLGVGLGFGAAALAISYAALLGLIAFALRVVPTRCRPVAGAVYGALFVSGVFLGGNAFLGVQVVLLLAALPARRDSIDRTPIPLGTWMCIGALLVLATADPFAAALQNWLPWHTGPWVPSLLPIQP